MIDRTLAPASFPVKNFNFRTYRKIILNDHIEGLVIPDKQHPICSIEIIFRSGSWFEKNPGVAFLTGKMLLEGTTTKNGEEIALAFEHMGAHSLKPLFTTRNTFYTQLPDPRVRGH